MKIQLCEQRSYTAYRPVNYYCRHPQESKIKQWISNICYRILDWLEDRVYEEPYQAYKSVIVDTNNVADFISKSLDEVIRHTHKRPEIVLLGQYEFRALTQNQDWLNPVTFPINIVYGKEEIRYGMPVRSETTLGLKIIVVPWMDGIVVLPSEEDLH